MATTATAAPRRIWGSSDCKKSKSMKIFFFNYYYYFLKVVFFLMQEMGKWIGRANGSAVFFVLLISSALNQWLAFLANGGKQVSMEGSKKVGLETEGGVGRWRILIAESSRLTLGPNADLVNLTTPIQCHLSTLLNPFSQPFTLFFWK